MRIIGTFVICLLVALVWIGPGTNARTEVASANQILAQATGTVLSRLYFPFLVDEPTYTPTVTFTPTLTPIPTNTPTPTNSLTPYPPIIATFVAELTGTANPAATQTAVHSAIQTSVAATVVAITSPTPIPPPALLLRFASAAASSDNNSNNLAGYAFDQNVETFWRPVSGANGQLIDLSFSSPQTVQYVRFITAMGDTVVTTSTVSAGAATPTPPATNFRVRLMNPNESPCFDTVQQFDRAVVQVTCPTTSNVSAVRIYVDSTNSQIPAGLREAVAYGSSALPFGTPTQVSTFGTTFTVTPNAAQTRFAIFDATYRAESSATMAVYLTQTAVSAGHSPG